MGEGGTKNDISRATRSKTLAMKNSAPTVTNLPTHALGAAPGQEDDDDMFGDFNIIDDLDSEMDHSNTLSPSPDLAGTASSKHSPDSPVPPTQPGDSPRPSASNIITTSIPGPGQVPPAIPLAKPTPTPGGSPAADPQHQAEPSVQLMDTEEQGEPQSVSSEKKKKKENQGNERQAKGLGEVDEEEGWDGEERQGDQDEDPVQGKNNAPAAAHPATETEADDGDGAATEGHAAPASEPLPPATELQEEAIPDTEPLPLSPIEESMPQAEPEQISPPSKPAPVNFPGQVALAKAAAHAAQGLTTTAAPVSQQGQHASIFTFCKPPPAQPAPLMAPAGKPSPGPSRLGPSRSTPAPALPGHGGAGLLRAAQTRAGGTPSPTMQARGTKGPTPATPSAKASTPAFGTAAQVVLTPVPGTAATGGLTPPPSPARHHQHQAALFQPDALLQTQYAGREVTGVLKGLAEEEQASAEVLALPFLDRAVVVADDSKHLGVQAEALQVELQKLEVQLRMVHLGYAFDAAEAAVVGAGGEGRGGEGRTGEGRGVQPMEGVEVAGGGC